MSFSVTEISCWCCIIGRGNGRSGGGLPHCESDEFKANTSENFIFYFFFNFKPLDNVELTGEMGMCVILLFFLTILKICEVYVFISA